jgi:SpoVK/Ycf46/Vps4 family AAA+-type ATPase
MICSASCTVFSLDDHEWYSVDVGGLNEKQWRPQAFERLVLDPKKKATLANLAKSNSRKVESKRSEDVIEGKGRGTVLLLHGPPGVGKTVSHHKHCFIAFDLLIYL